MNGAGRLIDAVRHRVAPTAEQGGVSLWRWPVAAGLLAVVAAMLLARGRADPTSTLGRLAWPGNQESATVTLQVVVASVMAATSITFSLVVVALQVASQQFSPRLLRGFARDPALKVVLAVLVATFAYSTTLLRSSDDDGLPAVAMLGTYVSVLASLGALLAFINHMATALRVDAMMRRVHADTRRGIERFYPPHGTGGSPAPPAPPADAVAVNARSSGFVRLIDVSNLVERARDAGAVVALGARPGDHVVLGAPIAVVWASARDADVAPDQATELVERGVDIAYERTLQQDPSYGFRELTDIAVKALSPGINDPVTAIHAVGHMADLLVRLTGRRLGPHRHEDDAGVLRVITVDRDLRYYLDLSCGQVRRYGAREPSVLIALLRLLRDVAVSCRDDDQRREVRRQVQLILGMVPDDLLAEDAGAVRDVAERVEQALRGDVLDAYSDRSGETRSS